MSAEMRRGTWLGAAVAVVVLLSGGIASALWTAGGTGNAAAKADTLPTGATPTTSVAGTTVTVSFNVAKTVTGNVSASAYAVTRYGAPTGGPAVPVSCTITTVGTTATCTDTPGAGTWYYTDTPKLAAWVGGESNRSSATSTIAATKLAFTAQPTNKTGGQQFSVAVTVEDASNNPVIVSGTAVTIGFGTNAGSGTLSGTTTVNTDSNGVATFSSLSVDKIGTGYTLAASSTGLSGTTSNTFSILVGAPSQLSFGTAPSSPVAAGAPISPSVTVRILDAGGNVTTSTLTVTIAIGANPGGATLGGTLSRGAVGGIATFSALTISVPGVGYTLEASASGVSSVMSGTFTVPPLAITGTSDGGGASKVIVSGGGGSPTAPSITVKVCLSTFTTFATCSANSVASLTASPGIDGKWSTGSSGNIGSHTFNAFAIGGTPSQTSAMFTFVN
jgi:hypothetical protein